MRSFIHIIESVESIGYHVTPFRNLKSIRMSGLVPKIGARSKRAGEATPGIYLFPSIQAVEAACQNWLLDDFGKDERLALLRVEIPADAEVSPGAGFETVLTAVVPPENLNVLSSDLGNEAGLSHLNGG
jgi:hypothetical protein